VAFATPLPKALAVMARAAVAFLIAPLLISLLFGPGAVFAYPIMLAITVVVAMPLFVILQKFKLLNWWHAALSGAACSLCFVVYDIYDIDVLISKNSISYVALGTLTGFIFWWIGIYKNPRFEFVPKAFPVSTLVLLPVIAIGVWIHQQLEYERLEGRVLAITDDNPYPIASNRCTAAVRLSSGQETLADFWGCDWPRDSVINKCFHLDKRWSTLRFKYVYAVSTGFGGGVDDC
jgi:hypothetical protein